MSINFTSNINDFASTQSRATRVKNFTEFTSKKKLEKQQRDQEQGEAEEDDPEEIAVEESAGGEFVAADRAAVLVGGDRDRAAGAFAGRKIRMGIDLHRRKV